MRSGLAMITLIATHRKQRINSLEDPTTMSEYQSYEWQAIDRPLTPEEQAKVGRLSSHIEVNATRAWVEYHWSSFRHDPSQVLADYFDAFLYWANWGDPQLMFRFPADLFDPAAVEPYCVQEYIELYQKGDSYILEIRLDEEEAWDWFERDMDLGSVAPLRNDILRGDYRALYLAWLKAVELSEGMWGMEDGVEEYPEPPAPAGLGKLTAPLRSFAQMFSIDSSLLKAAARASAEAPPPPSDQQWRDAIARLPRSECDDFLLRLLKDEPLLGLTLRRRLEALDDMAAFTPHPDQQQRSYEDVLAVVEDIRQKEKRKRQEAERRRREAQEARRRQRLVLLADREPELWMEVEGLVKTYKPKDYDRAVEILKDLRDIADHKRDAVTFQARLSELCERYRRRSSFIARVKAAQLT